MKNFFKKYGMILFWVILIGVIVYFSYKQNQPKSPTPDQVQTQKSDSSNATIKQLTEKYQAVPYSWVSDSGIKHTLDLQNKLIGRKPIVVLTSIDDIYNQNGKYFLKADVWTISDNTYTLNVECGKEVVGGITKELDLFDNKFVFVVNIKD